MFLPVGVSRIRPMSQPNLGHETCLFDLHAYEVFENMFHPRARLSFRPCAFTPQRHIDGCSFDLGRLLRSPWILAMCHPQAIVRQQLPFPCILRRYSCSLPGPSVASHVCRSEPYRQPTIAGGKQGAQRSRRLSMVCERQIAINRQVFWINHCFLKTRGSAPCNVTCILTSV